MKTISYALIFLLSCVSAAFSEPLSPIKIGWIGPLTGNSAALGTDSAEIVKMVFDKANASGGVHGHPLHLIVEDDQYSTAKTVTAYNKLVHQDHVNFIFALT